VSGASSCGLQGKRVWAYSALLAFSSAGFSANAQDISYSRKQSVTMQPPPIASIYRGHPGTVQLQFRVSSGLHINSNQPKEEYLKKTELKLDAPTDITIEKVIYPDGQDRTFPFAPDEPINVYSGDFPIEVVVRPLKTVIPMKYAVHGWLFYQACDNAACYPPKRLPMSFEIKVVKPATENKKRIPPQSPHTHD
jgi:hypothetical protein